MSRLRAPGQAGECDTWRRFFSDELKQRSVTKGRAGEGQTGHCSSNSSCVTRVTVSVGTHRSPRQTLFCKVNRVFLWPPALVCSSTPSGASAALMGTAGNGAAAACPELRERRPPAGGTCRKWVQAALMALGPVLVSPANSPLPPGPRLLGSGAISPSAFPESFREEETRLQRALEVAGASRISVICLPPSALSGSE